MNKFFSITLFLFLFASCSTEVVKDTNDEITEDSSNIHANEADEIKQDKTYLFESTEEGVKEFLRCTQKADGSKQWVYSTVKKPKEIKLGSREEAGFEVIYFFSNPDELYWVYGAECGFTLSNDTKRTSQWYAQVQPQCSEDPF